MKIDSKLVIFLLYIHLPNTSLATFYQFDKPKEPVLIEFEAKELRIHMKAVISKSCPHRFLERKLSPMCKLGDRKAIITPGQALNTFLESCRWCEPTWANCKVSPFVVTGGELSRKICSVSA